MSDTVTTAPPAPASSGEAPSPATPPLLSARLLGAAFPSVKNLSQTQAVRDAKESFRASLEELIRTGESEFLTFGPPFDANKLSFSVEVFSASDDAPLFEYHHLGESHKDDFDGERVNGDTLYRIASVTKLLAIYTLLAKLGTKHLDESIAKYIPELKEPAQTGVGATRWDDVTLRSLASMLSGISRDFALSDMSSNTTRDPAWPKLDDGEVIACRALLNLGDPDAEQLTLEESLDMIRKRHPMSSPLRAPFYSNTAFQLIAMAYERITGETIDDGFTNTIAKPLGLKRSSFVLPGDKANAAVHEPYWSFDLAPYRAAGNAYSTTSDLAAVGRSILRSTLLTPSQTNAWLKPASHTGSHHCSVGMPWEILRFDLPLVGEDGPSRPVDLYTKQGAIPPYTANFALSPDHGFGFVILTRGYGITAITELAVNAWVAAVEAAARAEAAEKLAGRYERPPTAEDSKEDASNDGKGTYITLSVKDDRTGLVIDHLFVNGVDILNTVWRRMIPFQSVELWPTGDITDDGERIYQALEQYGAPLKSKTGKTLTLGNLENAAWVTVEDWSYGGYGLNEFVVKTDEEGRGLSVNGLAWRTGEMSRAV